MVRLDSANYTSSSEYSNRTRSITHLQIHHATTTSLAGLRALMAPGGRTVSANGAMGNDGHLMGVVPEDKRAFTSASSFDNNSYTIEVCNTTLSPNWGISDACHWRLAHVAVDLHRQYGMPLDRAHIIGHSEVPGTYPTACPGPSMDLNRIVRYAHQLLTGVAGDGSTPIGVFMALSDQDQAELLIKTRAIYDALFKLEQVAGTTTGGNPMPGGLLRMASINFDATVQREGENGATRDGTLVALDKIKDKLEIE